MGVVSRLASLARKPALRQGGIVLIDQGALSLATFVVGILVARATSKEEYGLYILGWSLLLILQGFHKALVGVPFTVYAPRLSPPERTIYQGSTLVHTLVLGLIISAMLMFFWLWNPLQHTPQFTGIEDLLPLLAITVIPFMTRDFMRNAMLAQLEVSASVLVNLTATVFLVIVLGALFATKTLTVNNSFYTYAATSCAAAVYMIVTYRTRIKFVGSRLISDLARGWRIGKWIVVNAMGYTAASQAYPWMLLYFIDPETVAVFGACLAIAGLFTPLLRGATAYILPRMAHAYKDGDDINLSRMLRLSLLVLGLPYGVWFIVGSIMGDQLVTLFYTDAYQGYGLLVALLLAKTFVESVSTPLTNVLQTLERTDVTAVALIIGAVVTLGLGPIVIPQAGLNGAGWAALLSSVATAAWKWFSIRKILRQKDQSRKSRKH
jgi:O-antigen/teichoic acid export membrane protein